MWKIQVNQVVQQNIAFQIYLASDDEAKEMIYLQSPLISEIS